MLIIDILSIYMLIIYITCFTLILILLVIFLSTYTPLKEKLIDYIQPLMFRNKFEVFD